MSQKIQTKKAHQQLMLFIHDCHGSVESNPIINLSFLKVETHKINWKAESKINSRENINYQPGGIGSVSPTRSANTRRARSRSSHGNSRTNGNGAEENVVNGVRLTASAAPYMARRSSRPREKVNGNEVNGQDEG